MSRHVPERLLPAVVVAALVVACAAASPQPEDALPVEWEHHHASFSYVGITTAYNCDSLAGQVRRILLYLGARNDLTVAAQGCPLDRPSRTARVEADFFVPAPAETGAMSANWTAVRLDAQNPRFMTRGDCELMEGLKDLVVKNFHLRDLEYTTRCSPHELSNADFSVTGAAPKALPIQGAPR